MFFLNLIPRRILGLLGCYPELSQRSICWIAPSGSGRFHAAFLGRTLPALDEQRRRKRVREPWSLLFNLSACCCCCWPSRNCNGEGANARAAITFSCWTRHPGWRSVAAQQNLLDEQRELPGSTSPRFLPRDRVMLIRVDSLSTPATRFTDDRKEFLQAVAASHRFLLGIESAASI